MNFNILYHCEKCGKGDQNTSKTYSRIDEDGFKWMARGSTICNCWDSSDKLPINVHSSILIEHGFVVMFTDEAEYARCFPKWVQSHLSFRNKREANHKKMYDEVNKTTPDVKEK